MEPDLLVGVRQHCNGLPHGAANPVGGLMGDLVYLHPRQEPWISKKQLALLLGVGTRYIEYRMEEGMPSRLLGGVRQYQLSAVESWLRDNGHLEGDDAA